MKRSLQSTLGLGLLISLLLVFLILWIVASDAIRVVAENYMESRLEFDAESLLAATTQSVDKEWLVDRSKLSANYNRPFSGHYYKIKIDHRKILSRSLWDLDMPTVPNIDNNVSPAFVTGPLDQFLFVIQRRYSKQNQTIEIQIAEDFSPIESEIISLQIKLAFTASILLALLILLQTGLMQRSLRPLKKTSDELLLLERGEIQQLNIEVPKEINPLVNEINRLFAAMSLRLRRSRNAIGDLSHSLKKPLTVLQQLVANRETLEDDEFKQEINAQISSINNIIGRNLKKARLAGDGPGGANFVISKDLVELVKTIRMMYPQTTINILNDKCDVDLLPYDRDDILELLGNVIDNAAKWAESQVQVSIRCEKTPTTEQKCSITFLIEDDGPGIPADKISELLQRGSRLDEAIEGQGMGLAIANDIISEYSGTLIFAKSVTLQGLKASIHLPM